MHRFSMPRRGFQLHSLSFSAPTPQIPKATLPDCNANIMKIMNFRPNDTIIFPARENRDKKTAPFVGSCFDIPKKWIASIRSSE